MVRKRARPVRLRTRPTGPPAAARSRLLGWAPLRRAHAPMNCHLYHGDAGEETANKTIIIMCITTLMFNKCIFTNIDRFHYFILFKRSKIVSFSISARLFPVLSSITSLIISFLFCARSLYIFFISCPCCVL